MRNRLIAAAIVIGLLILSVLIVSNTECRDGQKIGSKILIQGC